MMGTSGGTPARAVAPQDRVQPGVRQARLTRAARLPAAPSAVAGCPRLRSARRAARDDGGRARSPTASSSSVPYRPRRPRRARGGRRRSPPGRVGPGPTAVMPAPSDRPRTPAPRTPTRSSPALEGRPLSAHSQRPIRALDDAAQADPQGAADLVPASPPAARRARAQPGARGVPPAPRPATQARDTQSVVATARQHGEALQERRASRRRSTGRPRPRSRGPGRRHRRRDPASRPRWPPRTRPRPAGASRG